MQAVWLGGHRPEGMVYERLEADADQPTRTIGCHLRSRSMPPHGDKSDIGHGLERRRCDPRRLGSFRAFLAGLAFATEAATHSRHIFLEGGSDDSASGCIALTALSGRALR